MTGYTNPVPIGDIPEGWKIQSIDSLCRNITSGGTPLRSISRFYQNGTIKWIKTKELKDWYIDDSEEKITEEALEESSAKLFPPNTVLMAMYGDGRTITSLGILRTESATNQACCALIANPDICDHLYLFYSLKYHRADFIQLATGGAQRNLSGTLIRNFAIRVPPLVEQHAIARILSSLDDKIELNRRMNETLEAIARAIFKSWFVDFDPVRAKAEGQVPVGMDSETAALFPDGFEETELGIVPKGWKYGTIEDLCLSIENGGTPKRLETDYWNYGTIPWFKTGELTDGPLIDSEEAITEQGLSNSSCKLWPKDTILIALYASPTVGRLGILEVAGTANQACSALIAKPEYGYLFLFYKLLFSREELQNIAVGAAQQNISQQVVRRHNILIPSPETAFAFQQLAKIYYLMQLNNKKQSGILAATRDELLSKLLSGKIRTEVQSCL